MAIRSKSKSPKAKSKTNWLTHLKIFAAALGAGLCMALPFMHYHLGWLSLVCLLPLFYLLQTKLVRARPLPVIWLSGWAMMLGVVFWIIQTQPERWAALTGWWAIGGLVLTFVLFSGLLSLGFVVVGWLYGRLKVDLLQTRALILLPAIWVLGEWTRSIVFSVISLGPNTTLGPHWNFGHLGFAVSVTPVVFMARFVGLYGLGFVVVLFNLCLFLLLHKRWKMPVVILLGIGVFSLVGWGVYHTANGKTVQVGALQLGTNENLQIGSIDYHDKLKGKAPAGSLDVLVLSEYSDVFNDQTKQADIEAISTIARNNDTPVITSRQRNADNRTYNTISVYRPDGAIAYEHDKQFLIPVGEAMPYAYIYLFKMLGQGGTIDMQQQSREISRGSDPAQGYQLDGLRLGSMACSGAISPELYRGLVVDGAELLTNSASLSIFSKAPTYHQQAQQMARFMAVANSRPFVQATDGSYSFVLDHNGRWLSKSRQKDLQLLQQAVAINSQRTVYSLLGEWVVWLSAGLVLGAFYFQNRNIRR